jgi:signal transduction histidine kinase
VNIMQSRLRDYVSDRENLAAALAHDLRTPLTRMKLRCELMRSSKDKQLLQGDIEQLEAIVASVILATICDEVPTATVAPETEALHRVVISAHPVQLTRCLRNLVENAVRYGGAAQASVVDHGTTIEIHVDDEGPGIPQEKLAEVIKPFVRLEASRNQAFGGTGLGLAIAESIARSHGGSLILVNRQPRGLRATVSLPKAAAS